MSHEDFELDTNLEISCQSRRYHHYKQICVAPDESRRDVNELDVSPKHGRIFEEFKHLRKVADEVSLYQTVDLWAVLNNRYALEEKTAVNFCKDVKTRKRNLLTIDKICSMHDKVKMTAAVRLITSRPLCFVSI